MAKVKKHSGWYRRNGNVYIDKMVRGTRLPVENAGPLTDRQATELVAKRVAAFLEKRYFPELMPCCLTVHDVLKTYDAESLSKLASVKHARYHIERLDKKLGDKPATKLIWPNLTDYAKERIAEEGVGTVTVEAELSQLSSAYNWCRDYDAVVPGQADRVELHYSPFPRRWKKKLYTIFPYTPHDQKILDEGAERGHEWLSILNNAGPHVRLALLTQYETGMRSKEVRHLEREWIHVTPTGAKIVLPPGIATKNHNGREIIISADLAADLLARAGKVYVFESDTGGVHTYGWMQNGLKRAAVKGNVALPPGSGTHTLRRTRATIDGQKGDIQAAMDKLGHADFSTFARYSQVTPLRRRRLAGT